MPASPPPAAVWADVFCCLGLGLGLGALRQLAGLLLGRGFWRDFALDLLGFCAGAAVLFGFAAGRSAVGVVRWYMAAGAALGAAGWHWSCAAAVQNGADTALRLLALPCRFGQTGLRAVQKRRPRKKSRRKKDKLERNAKNRLQKRGKVIYN